MAPVISMVEIRSGVFYDSRTLGASDRKVSDLFAKPNSAATEPVGYFHNLDAQGGMIPKDEEAVLDGIAFSLEGDKTIAQWTGFMKGVLTVFRNKRETFTIPIRFLPSMGGLFIATNQGLTTGGADSISSGVPSANNFLPLDPAIEIVGGQQFSVQLEWATAPGAILFWVLFRAAHKRPGLA